MGKINGSYNFQISTLKPQFVAIWSLEKDDTFSFSLGFMSTNSPFNNKASEL